MRVRTRNVRNDCRWPVTGTLDLGVGQSINQSRTRRSPPAKQSTVRIEGIDDADGDDIGGGIEGVLGVGWKDQLSFVGLTAIRIAIACYCGAPSCIFLRYYSNPQLTTIEWRRLND